MERTPPGEGTKVALIAVALVALAAGLAFRVAGRDALAAALWSLGVLPVLVAVSEVPGEGGAGQVEGREVIVGGHGFVAARLGLPPGPAPDHVAEALILAVAVDGRPALRLVMADPLRAGVAGTLARLRRAGVGRILLATGDRAAVAERVAQRLRFDGLRTDLKPDQKVLLVRSERRDGPVMMVGDGVNDAPALAAANVGVAMGARGAAASAGAAEVVLLVDRLDRPDAGMEIARRARGIALQSVVAGLGLPVLGMVAAAFGHLDPVEGALFQEVIDVAVILNALRTLRIVPARADTVPAPAPDPAAVAA